jgi:starch phosphorylase
MSNQAELPESTRVAAAADIPTIGPYLADTRIAYFSMEIAIRPDIHTYSGGLGVLAGDTARTAADLELPMVFVTLASHQGYLRQEINHEGRQIEHPDPWPIADHAVPLRAKVALLIEDREVWVRPWLFPLLGGVGYRLPVLLLDTNLPENAPEDRLITDRLYGGDAAYRLKQEIVLGIGGLRILQAIGFDIHTYHLNEGHAALLALDLLRRYPRAPDQINDGEVAFDVERVRRMCIFTTHTPIEAGHDRFDYDLVERTLHGYVDSAQLRLIAGADSLNMTQLAMNLSGFVNGVAERHALTSSRMFPGYRIRAVTNGVHLPTWTHPAFADLYNAHSHSWAFDPQSMVRFDHLPAGGVLKAHQQAKQGLADHVRSTLGVELDPNLPILGYARRMTSYKRPHMLFSDLERLRAIHHAFPFQVVMAGKAHPADAPGKETIRRIHEWIRQLEGGPRVVFLPNYDMGLAQIIVPGVDVWLNTPEPPLEASGTSGMKAAINGVLNLSVLDGWWIEACMEGITGWAIGHDGEPTNASAHPEDLYDKLERVVLPLWYNDRDKWLWMMRQAISKVASYFNTQRMMRRYAAEAYILRRPPSRAHGLDPRRLG